MKNLLLPRLLEWVLIKPKSKLEQNLQQIWQTLIDLKHLMNLISFSKNSRKNRRNKKSKRNKRSRKKIKNKRKRKTNNTSIVIEIIHKKKIKRKAKRTNTENVIDKKNNNAKEKDQDHYKDTKENATHHPNREAATLIDCFDKRTDFY